MTMSRPSGLTGALAVAERRFLGHPTWIKADRTATSGRLSVIEQIIPAGFASPWHVHRSEDEFFYVFAGQMTVIVDAERTLLRAGDTTFGPRGIAHGFRTEGVEATHLLVVTTGGDFADFIAEASVPAGSPPAAPDVALLAAIAARHNTEVLGPLPE